MARRKPLKYMALMEYTSGENFHHFTTSTQAADAWAASMMREHGNYNLRVTILEVLFSING